MTNPEFSSEFDILYNNISSNQAPGLDEYEKSVFLTKFQEEFIIAIYSGKSPTGGSFEKTEEVRRYLSNLVKTYKTSKQDKMSRVGVSDYSVFFKLPEDLWYITYESVNLEDDKLGCKSGDDITVTPITQDTYHRIKNNPFRNSNERRVLRLDINDDIVELISRYNIKEYMVRYLSKPSPIILTDLDEIDPSLTINGENKQTECLLDSSVHRALLEGAVNLALKTFGLNRS